ncbi:beta-amylase 2 chloroplastic [Phtheirospermum japonicum]|uniref:Beta-amylase n=1 Tax=Phtheirospermum japonicum TaxID=374723 RepID=A0A830C2P4_9LAMI|nr:beta-amylase 2 chloroplastic [Phtheirospermum japonicum]
MQRPPARLVVVDQEPKEGLLGLALNAKFSSVYPKTSAHKPKAVFGLGYYRQLITKGRHNNALLIRIAKENYCPEKLDTYNGVHPDGSITYGGYSDIMVAKEDFIICWPDNFPMDWGAPLVCAGITTYSPLRYYGLDKPGLHVGVSGMGGLGHVAVKFLKAFGTNVTVIDIAPEKKTYALETLGADQFLLPHELESAKGTLDGILDAVAAFHSIQAYLDLLKPEGKLCYDKYTLKSLRKAAETRGHSFWACGPENTGSYNSRPHEAGFFCDGVIMMAITQALVDHGDRVLSLAKLAFEGTRIAVKLSGIHWWYKTTSHAAELTAGFNNSSNRDGYAAVMAMLKKHGAALCFTCSKTSMIDNHIDFSESLADPEGLAWQLSIRDLVLEGLSYLLEKAKPVGDPDGRHFPDFTYLRLNPHLMDRQNLIEFEQFVKKMHGEAVLEYQT